MFESPGETSECPLAIALVEVCRTKVLERGPATEDVEGDDEEVVGDGEGRALGTPPRGEALMQSTQVGWAAASSLGRLDEHGAEPGAALPGTPGVRLAGTLVVAGTETSPRREMARAREPARTRHTGALVVLLGEAAPGLRPVEAAEILQVFRPLSFPEVRPTLARPTTTTKNHEAALRWWIDRLNSLFGEALDVSRYQDANSYVNTLS